MPIQFEKKKKKRERERKREKQLVVVMRDDASCSPGEAVASTSTAPEAAPAAAAAFHLQQRCVCGSISYSDEYLKAFGVYLCNHCIKQNESLITKVSEERKKRKNIF